MEKVIRNLHIFGGLLIRTHIIPVLFVYPSNSSKKVLQSILSSCYIGPVL